MSVSDVSFIYYILNERSNNDWNSRSKILWVLKNWCFWTVVLEKILESFLDSKEIKPVNQEINPEYSLERLMLKLKLQYFGNLMQRADLLEKTLTLRRARGEGSDRGCSGWNASPMQWTWVWANSGRWWRRGKPGMLQSMGPRGVRRDWVTKQQLETMLCPPKSRCWSPILQWDCFWREGLVSLQEELPRIPFSPSPSREEKTAFYKPGSELSPETKSVSILIFGLPKQNCEKEISVV